MKDACTNCQGLLWHFSRLDSRGHSQSRSCKSAIYALLVACFSLTGSVFSIVNQFEIGVEIDINTLPFQRNEATSERHAGYSFFGNLNKLLKVFSFGKRSYDEFKESRCLSRCFFELFLPSERSTINFLIISLVKMLVSYLLVKNRSIKSKNQL